jgi:hypothetical protein
MTIVAVLKRYSAGWDWSANMSVSCPQPDTARWAANEAIRAKPAIKGPRSTWLAAGMAHMAGDLPRDLLAGIVKIVALGFAQDGEESF